MPHAFLSRQPLINRQHRVIAYRLLLWSADGSEMSDPVGTLASLADVWPTSDKPIFVGCENARCTAALLDWAAPANSTIEVQAAALLDAQAGPRVGATQSRPPSICLHFDPQAVQALACGVPLRFIGLDSRHFTLGQLKLLAMRTKPYGIGIAFNVETPEDFRAALDAGVSAGAGWFFTKRTAVPAKALSPMQANIVRVLNLVRNNAEVRDIEVALKQDVALSYKLLRYINSAGFGLSCEIQSFRHAVSILGFDKLNRWLSLLLVTASKDALAPALMHTALLRARLMELLAIGLVDRAEYDHVFITGAFSLLDALLGVNMETALETMRLPDAISSALLGEGGPYQPFLELALASEQGVGSAIAEQVAMLGLTVDQFNRAQLQALAFADTMEL